MTVFADHPRIARYPGVCSGKPVIAGTRIPVDVIVRHLGAGATMEWVLKGYPELTEADILAALAFAADLVEDAAE